MDDGLLDLVMLGDINFREVLGNLQKLREGTHLSNPKVKWTRCKKVSARSEHDMLVEEDGEIVGSLPAEFEIKPKSLLLVY